ncbi:hypothetical protein Pla163_03760 [Planctomycetes bacterium Pla163]|uniref:AhpC/TSA family protein n=1 Tax=Rohdeia mirabilis TaxID=2528008 RepID=A0A518CVQ5_9BACT|nr:hypothetical protein Pla163_03760 [Planctomycetes bacterium Pla163]
MLLVAQGTVQQADEFFEGRWPEARVVSDTERRLYPAFGLRRASLGQMFSLKVVKAFWKHRMYGVGRPVGDTFLLSGAFVVAGADVSFAHRGETPADHPKWSDLLERVRQARGAPTPT